MQLQNSFPKFAFSAIWRTWTKYNTKKHTFAKLCFKQMTKIQYKNICAFVRHPDFRVGGVFYFELPCILYIREIITRNNAI